MAEPVPVWLIQQQVDKLDDLLYLASSKSDERDFFASSRVRTEIIDACASIRLALGMHKVDIATEYFD